MDGAEPADLSFGAEVPSVPSVQDLQVEPGKLLDVATVIEGQADGLRKRVREALEALRIEQPAQDLVSTHAVRGWNAVIVEDEDSYYQRVLAYADGLGHLAERLRSAGERYRAGDDEQVAAVAQAGSGN